MRVLAAAALLAALAGCSGGDGETTVARKEAPPPAVRTDPAARYAYVLVPEYARLRKAFVGWLLPCVYIKQREECIARNAAFAASARRVLARLAPAPPELREADRLLRAGFEGIAAAADRQRRLLLARDETGYLNSFSPFILGAFPDVTNGIGELREHVPGARLPLLAGLPIAEARAELRSP